ncbi:gag-pol polyprotein [Cucumis melo var. makuwa]|uniref:Gag-pol polyprotein n=1 Tax=Cucumis melo var. makuwa TaxID=1194695 RepID=A0A5A7UDN6_CUCMM|nr:gag-pol polyprotein [Cucumis melo var. makuwa]TYK29403.1 gag-pol polyprotein [Cucumis melo var. makuwa]
MLQEMARAMIHAKALSIHFWAEALITACHIHYWLTLQHGTTCTSYELWKGRKPNVKYFHIFVNTCFISSHRDQLRKWDSKFDRRIFLGYSTNSQAYRVYNQCTKTAMESINVIVDDHSKMSNSSFDEEDGLFWVRKSQNTKPSVLAYSSLIEDSSSYRPSEDSVTIPTVITLADHLEISSSECSIFDYQQTTEHSSQNDNTDVTNSTESSMQKLVPSTHIAKNHPSNAIIGDV